MFGSVHNIQVAELDTSETETMELATALESTGRSFIWAFRPPLGIHVDIIGGEERLPEGFEAWAGAANRGLLVHDWAPQVARWASSRTA
jgi:hypothetical protein